MELPAPINVIFGIITSFRRRAPFYIKLVFHCSYKLHFDKVFLQDGYSQKDGERGYQVTVIRILSLLTGIFFASFAICWAWETIAPV